MRYYVYVCDNCGKILDNKKSWKEHISLEVNRAGWVEKGKEGWVFKYKLDRKNFQFCNENCLKEFFVKSKFRKFCGK